MASLAVTIPVATNLFAASIALVVGLRLARHRPAGDPGRAVLRFSAWWIGLAAFITLNQIATLAALAGANTPGVIAPLSYAANTALMACLWGLVSYVLYLFTGKPRALTATSVAYALQLVAILAWIASMGPQGVIVTDAGTQTDWARDPSPGESGLFALTFLLPPIVSSVALGILSFSSGVEGRTSRFRMRAIAVGIFIWFTGAIVITASGAPAATTSIVGPIVGTLCMLLIVSAYRPPAWLQARGIRPFGEGPLRAPPRPDRNEALMRRVRELI